MLTFMRWKPGTVAQYQYFEVNRGRWVDCERSMYLWFVHQGAVWMNPVFDPSLALAKAA